MDLPTPSVRVGDPFEALDLCHRDTLLRLQDLQNLVDHVCAEGPDAKARALAVTIEAHFSGAVRRHHQDEERHIFPELAEKGDEQTREAIERLRQDHDWFEADWNELRPLVDAIACGQSWYDPETLRSGVEVLGALYRDHIALEESLIYPQARWAMNPEKRAAMEAEMLERRETEIRRRTRRTAA